MSTASRKTFAKIENKSPASSRSASTKKDSTPPRPFSVYVRCRTFLSSTPRGKCSTPPQGPEYSMSPAEYQSCCHQKAGLVMRDVKTEHKQILNGSRDTCDARQKYLTARWDSSTPREKFYFPAATSWRYGWLLQQKKQSNCYAAGGAAATDK